MLYQLFTILILSFFIIGCEKAPIEIESSQIEKSVSICTKNLGLDKIFAGFEESAKKYVFTTLCKNGAFTESIPTSNSNKSKFKSEYHISSQELDQCINVCKENEMIKKININLVCLKDSPPFTRYRTCDIYGISISCVCNNSITKIVSERPMK